MTTTNTAAEQEKKPREETIVRVLIDHHAKPGEADRVVQAITDLRKEAMKQPGNITGETLINVEDPSNVLVISTWRNVKDWQAWDTSPLRIELTKKQNALLEKPYTVKMYHYKMLKEHRVWSTV